MLGSLLTVDLLVVGALVFLPRGIFPDLLSAAPLAGGFPFSQKALLTALLGMLACIAGAAIETAPSGAYNVCQFLNYEWGKNRRTKDVPVYTTTWLGMFAFALAIGFTGLRPLQLVGISIIFGMVIMPLTATPNGIATQSYSAKAGHFLTHLFCERSSSTNDDDLKPVFYYDLYTHLQSCILPSKLLCLIVGTD